MDKNQDELAQRAQWTWFSSQPNPGDHVSHFFKLRPLDLFWWFVCERQAIWRRRIVERERPPWTLDPILRTYRFTNIYRELDPGTRFAIENILESPFSAKDKIFNVMLYRLIGKSDTFAQIGFQKLSDFRQDDFERKLKHIRDVQKKPPFTGAYMVAPYLKMGSRDKIENISRLLARLNARFDPLYDRICTSSSAKEVYFHLRGEYGFGKFLAYQALVDLLYPLRTNGDRPLLPFSHDDWAEAGPGAHKGILILLKSGFKPSDLEVMKWLHLNQRQEFKRLGLNFTYLASKNGKEIEISLANIQNCLCEYHKYAKIRNGSGRARRKFVLGSDSSEQLRIDRRLEIEA